jgi:polar amino acid transport system substrate-binding protein
MVQKIVSCQYEVTMKKLFYLLAVLFVGIVSAFTASCSKGDKDKPLVVACEAASSPYCYYLNANIDPPVAGIDVDLVEEIGKALGRPIEFKVVPFQNIFTLVSSGEADIGAAAITITPERAERVLFSTIYDTSTQVAVVPAESDIADEAALKEVRVAAQEGTTDLEYLREVIKPRVVLPYLTQEDVSASLSDRRADAAVMDQLEAEILVKRTGDDLRIIPKPLCRVQYGLIFNKADAELAEAANAVIDKYKTSGRLLKSREKHMEELWTHPGYGAMRDDYDGVKPFVVCLDPSFAPFAFMNRNRLAGVDIEMAEAIAEELKRPVQFRIVPFSEILPLVINGAADMGTSGISITPERSSMILFSNSYENSVRRILVKEGSKLSRLSDLDGKVIGAEKGTTNEEYAVNKLHAKKTVHYDNASEGIMGLLRNEIDAYIDDESEAELALEKNKGKIKMMQVVIRAEEYGFAFRLGNSEAKAAADRVIEAKRRNGDLQALFRKYTSIYKTIDLNSI